MTSQADIDALIRQLRERNILGSPEQRAADALESTATELRQERERARQLQVLADLHDAEDIEFDKGLARVKADLARAREVIEKARTWHDLAYEGYFGRDSYAQGYKMALRNIRRILAAYQKEEKS